MSEESRPAFALTTPMAVVIAGVLVAGGLYFGLANKGATTPANTGGSQPTQAVNIKDIKIAGQAYIGSESAPLTMAAWEDYQCPFCKEFETTVLPTLITKYVDTGKLKIVYKDFAFLGPDSTVDAEWSRAVWDLYPGKFEAWRAAMFSTQPQENSLSDTQNESRLEQVSATISGIDVAKVKAQVATHKVDYDKAIAADQAEGSSFGIQGTPGFIVGTASIDGAQPLSNFEQAIDSQLK